MSQTPPTRMRAAALDHYGGPEVITPHTLEVPSVADDELLLEEASQAHERMQGHYLGKLALHVSD